MSENEQSHEQLTYKSYRLQLRLNIDLIFFPNLYYAHRRQTNVYTHAHLVN